MHLTAAQLAAIAAGASVESVLAAAAIADPTAEELAEATAQAEVARLQAAADATAAAAAAATQAQADADAQAAAALAAAATPNPVVTHLTAQLAEAQEGRLAAEVKAAGFKAAADAQDGLLAIVREALGNKMVALGGTAATADTFTAANIAAEYTRVSESFKTKFKIGGVAVAAAAGEKKTHVDPMFAAVVQASLPK